MTKCNGCNQESNSPIYGKDLWSKKTRHFCTPKCAAQFYTRLDQQINRTITNEERRVKQ